MTQTRFNFLKLWLADAAYAVASALSTGSVCLSAVSGIRFCLICFSLAGESIWDDLGGERSYDRKGSLCHGRSTLPVYYFHLFNKPE